MKHQIYFDLCVVNYSGQTYILKYGHYTANIKMFTTSSHDFLARVLDKFTARRSFLTSESLLLLQILHVLPLLLDLLHLSRKLVFDGDVPSSADAYD